MWSKNIQGKPHASSGRATPGGHFSPFLFFEAAEVRGFFKTTPLALSPIASPEWIELNFEQQLRVTEYHKENEVKHNKYAHQSIQSIDQSIMVSIHWNSCSINESDDQTDC